MKKHIMKKALALLMSCALVGSLSACSLPFGNKDKEEEEDGAEIEASVSKVKVGVDEEKEIEIENYKDLNKLKFEVEDEDIATVEEDGKGVYIVTGVSEGKTTVTFTAKECEDLTIKITVEGDMEPQPTSGGAIELSSYDMTVDYSDYDAYLYITNWDDMTGANVTVTSSDPDVLYASAYPSEDGSIWLSAYGEGTVTVTVEADGYEPAYCTVEATNNSDSGNNNPGGTTTSDAVPAYPDENSDGSVNLWSKSTQSIIEVFKVPDGYTLDTENGSGATIFMDSDDVDGKYITIYSDMPYAEWDFVTNGNAEDGFTMDIRELGTYNGETVYIADRHDPNNQYDEYDMVQIFFAYEADGYTDYVTLEIYPELVDGWKDADFMDLFNEMLDN